MPRQLTITPEAHATVIAAAAAAYPYEACGLLLGTGAHIAAAQPAANVAADPARHFEIDPVALIAAHRAMRDGGPELVGYFHSHPNGLARPSATDAGQAAHDGRVWMIVAGGAVTCWSDGVGGFEPLSYSVVQG
ncbi:MAG: M67 family metallopeptidase [Pseudomonadota bacterium]